MPNDYLDLTELLKVNDRDNQQLDVSDILNDAPMLRALAAKVVPGTVNKYCKESTAPTVGFRAANTGRYNSHSADTEVTNTLTILDASFAIDKALADAYQDGAEALISREAVRHLRAAFYAAERQYIYGTSSDSSGFIGICDVLNTTSDTMVYNAGGTASATGSSLFAIRTGDNDCIAVAGNGGQISIAETVSTPIVDYTAGTNLTTFAAYYTPIVGYMGLQLGSTYSVGRLANLTAGVPLTDDLVAELLAKFPASRMPNLLVCNRRSLKQLRDSRTATSATGAPAPFPAEVFGIPLIVSDAISSTETIIS